MLNVAVREKEMCTSNSGKYLQFTESMIRLLTVGGTPLEAIDMRIKFEITGRREREEESGKRMQEIKKLKMDQIFGFNQIIPMQRKAPFICRFACRSINVDPLIVKTARRKWNGKRAKKLATKMVKETKLLNNRHQSSRKPKLKESSQRTREEKNTRMNKEESNKIEP